MERKNRTKYGEKSLFVRKKQENMLTPMGLNMKMNKSYFSFMVFYIYWVTMTLTRKKHIMETRQNYILEQFLTAEKRDLLVISAQKHNIMPMPLIRSSR